MLELFNRKWQLLSSSPALQFVDSSPRGSWSRSFLFMSRKISKDSLLPGTNGWSCPCSLWVRDKDVLTGKTLGRAPNRWEGTLIWMLLGLLFLMFSSNPFSPRWHQAVLWRGSGPLLWLPGVLHLCFSTHGPHRSALLPVWLGGLRQICHLCWV